MSATQDVPAVLSMKDLFDAYLDVIEAFASMAETLGKVEQRTGAKFDQTLFTTPSILKLLTTSKVEEIGKFFKFIFEATQYGQAMADVIKLSPTDKIQLARNLKQLVTKYRKGTP